MRAIRGAACALAVLMLGVPAVSPQANVVLSGLVVELWPDYDRPGLLVIYRATIAPGVALPTRLAFRIPAGAGVPSAVAERQADGQLNTLAHERTVAGDTALIEVIASRPVVQLEFYDPAIVRSGAERSFVFTWPGDYEVGDFNISVQEPDLARNFVMLPEATRSAPGVDGLDYHGLSLAGVQAGEAVAVQVSYEKASERLSVETMLPDDAPPAPATSIGTSDNQTLLLVAAAILVFAGVAIGALLIRSRSTARATSHHVPRPPVAGRRGKARRFCTQCGAGAAAEDRFCHGCGCALQR